MQRILVADDEPDIIRLITRYAEREGYEVVGVPDGLQAVEACRTQDFDLIVMDVMMPDTDGFTACKRIHAMKDIPVLMLSARGAEYDKLFGFEVGADDYVTKPFSPKELMARIRVIIARRGKDAPRKETTVSAQGIEIDVPGRSVRVDGEAAELTAKEFDILLLLMKNRGIVFSRDRIMNEVWGCDYFGVDRTVDWQIKLLRNKLGERRGCIRTIRGVGYKFEG